MLSFIESSAGRIADRIQSIGTAFDPEVLALPGGSVIALVLWAYTNIALTTQRALSAQRAARPTTPATVQGALPMSAPVAAVCTGCLGRK